MFLQWNIDIRKKIFLAGAYNTNHYNGSNILNISSRIQYISLNRMRQNGCVTWLHKIPSTFTYNGDTAEHLIANQSSASRQPPSHQGLSLYGNSRCQHRIKSHGNPRASAFTNVYTRGKLFNDNYLISPSCRIYASLNWVIIGLDNGLSPIRHQAITWSNAGLLSNGLLGIHFNENWNGILSFSFKKMHLEMSSAKLPAIFPGVDELIISLYDTGTQQLQSLCIIYGTFDCLCVA